MQTRRRTVENAGEVGLSRRRTLACEQSKHISEDERDKPTNLRQAMTHTGQARPDARRWLKAIGP
jgi:hypothetical protein